MTKWNDPEYLKEYMRKYMYDRRHEDEQFRERTTRSVRIGNRISRFKIKKEFFDLIGGSKCVCVGEECWHIGRCTVHDLRCMNADHKKSGGTKEREKMKLYGVALYEYFLEHPKEAKQKLQPLCANCNTVKRILDCYRLGMSRKD